MTVKYIELITAPMVTYGIPSGHLYIKATDDDLGINKTVYRGGHALPFLEHEKPHVKGAAERAIRSIEQNKRPRRK